MSETTLYLEANRQKIVSVEALHTFRGEDGASGVQVSSEAPTDPTVMVWIKPDAESDDLTKIRQDIDLLSEEKADRAYVAALFEQLRALILAGDTDGAVALLDQAILDHAVLG